MNDIKTYNWGVFIGNSNGETYELKLPEELAQKVWDFIENSDGSDVLGENTNGYIYW
tara:strand:+ start:651 stop:821 length:171 start_codon:yes stop_codon:yes gene_type:complete